MKHKPPGTKPNYSATIRVLELVALLLYGNKLTEKETAKYLKVSVKTVQRYMGVIKAAMVKSSTVTLLMAGAQIEKDAEEMSWRKVKKTMVRSRRSCTKCGKPCRGRDRELCGPCRGKL